MRFLPKSPVLGCVAFVVASFGVGCGSQPAQVAANSVVPDSGNLINTLLSEQPPAVKNKNRMQINYGASTVYPEAPMLSLYSAITKNPETDNFRVVWELSVVNHHSKRIVDYDRKTKMLRYEWQGRNHSHIINESAVFVGVTSDMIRQATVASIKSGKDNVFTTLPGYGCKRIGKG
jgi:hypothetical protein